MISASAHAFGCNRAGNNRRFPQFWCGPNEEYLDAGLSTFSAIKRDDVGLGHPVCGLIP